MGQPYERVIRSKKEIIINNFIGGISWAIGATIGVAIVFMVLSFLLRNANVVPIIGDFIVDINEYVLQNQPRLVK